jgi:hypothetical protein
LTFSRAKLAENHPALNIHSDFLPAKHSTPPKKSQKHVPVGTCRDRITSE